MNRHLIHNLRVQTEFAIRRKMLVATTIIFFRTFQFHSVSYIALK